jgi:NADH dehydrogenase
VSTRLEKVDGNQVWLSDGACLQTETLVWTAGVVPSPAVRSLGLPLDDRGRIVVDENLRVADCSGIWAIGDCAAVPNAATPGELDPPTCQHALRQARRLAKSLRGRTRPYRYRSHGQGATLGRLKGIARVFGVSLRGVPAAAVVRWYHISQVPQFSRALRIVLDSGMSLLFGRDYAETPGLAPAVGP